MNIRLQAVTRLVQLAPDARLRGCEDACLPQRHAGVACSACSAACPGGVLKVSADGFDLAPGCLDCGRCAAACPTHALELGGFHPDCSTARSISPCIDCERVPPAASPAGALRVPCSGALRASQLLALANASPDGTVTILDRGWCAECTAGGATHPAAARVDEVNSLLDITPGKPARRVVLAHHPLPPSLRGRAARDPGLERPLGRRDFLRQLVAHTASAARPDPTPAAIGSAAPPDGRTRILPAERLALLQQLQNGTHGQPLHAGLLQQIEIGPGCCNQQVCARSCPVAALHPYQDEDISGVAFEPALCIGCGACAANCPEQALRLVAAPAPRALPATTRLSRHTTQSCFDCGAPFVPRGARGVGEDDDPRCPACEKSRELGRSLFAGLF